jgi:hypothetical protein
VEKEEDCRGRYPIQEYQQNLKKKTRSLGKNGKTTVSATGRYDENLE